MSSRKEGEARVPSILTQKKICEILTKNGPCTVTEVFEELRKTDQGISRKIVARQLDRMTSKYKLIIKALYGNDSKDPVRNQILTYELGINYKGDFDVQFNLQHIQVLTWALLNLRNTSTNFFGKICDEIELSLKTPLSNEQTRQIEDSIKVFSQFVGVYKKPFSFKKNNLENLLDAIRDKKYITAKIKDYKLSKEERHQEKLLGIGSITFKNNIPYVIAYIPKEQKYESIRATRLNNIKVKDSNISESILDKIRKYDLTKDIQEIEIICTGQLAQIFKESIVNSTQIVTDQKNKNSIIVTMKTRISKSLVNLLLPHCRDIIALKPNDLKNTLENRVKENLAALELI